MERWNDKERKNIERGKRGRERERGIGKEREGERWSIDLCC